MVPHAVLPFAAKQGQKPIHYLGRGFYSSTMLKQASPDRIKELLRVADFLAAPFGSAEDLLLTTGVVDRDYNAMIDEGGNVYFLSKLFSTDGKSFQFAAGSMTGMTQEEYAEMMLKGGHSPEGVRSIKGKY